MEKTLASGGRLETSLADAARAVGVFGLALLLCGCAALRPREDPTRFYVLTAPVLELPNTAPRLGAARWRIAVRPIEVPSYLGGKPMVVRMGANEVVFSEMHRWAEPLDQGLARVLREALLTKANVGAVTLHARAEHGMDFVVSLRVLACEGVREPGAMPSVKFSVAWEARDLRGAGEADRMRGGVFQAAPRRWDGAHFGAFAEAVSGSVEELARMLNEVFGER